MPNMPLGKGIPSHRTNTRKTNSETMAEMNNDLPNFILLYQNNQMKAVKNIAGTTPTITISSIANRV